MQWAAFPFLDTSSSVLQLRPCKKSHVIVHTRAWLDICTTLSPHSTLHQLSWRWHLSHFLLEVVMRIGRFLRAVWWICNICMPSSLAKALPYRIVARQLVLNSEQNSLDSPPSSVLISTFTLPPSSLVILRFALRMAQSVCVTKYHMIQSLWAGLLPSKNQHRATNSVEKFVFRGFDWIGNRTVLLAVPELDQKYSGACR